LTKTQTHHSKKIYNRIQKQERTESVVVGDIECFRIKNTTLSMRLPSQGIHVPFCDENMKRRRRVRSTE